MLQRLCPQVLCLLRLCGAEQDRAHRSEVLRHGRHGDQCLRGRTFRQNDFLALPKIEQPFVPRGLQTREKGIRATQQKYVRH